MQIQKQYLRDKKEHIVSSVAFMAVTNENVKVNAKTFGLHRSPDCMNHFAHDIMHVVDEYFAASQQYRNYEKNSPEVAKAHQSNICWLCEKSNFVEGHCALRPVIDHCHGTGKILGLAHAECNAARVNNQFVPIYFHNLSSYDSHFIVNMLNNFGPGSINIIPKTGEKYIAITKHYTPKCRQTAIKLVFLDSYRMLPSSLDELATNLLKSNGLGIFKNLRKKFGNDVENLLWNEHVVETKQQTVLNENYDIEFKDVDVAINKPRLKGVFPYEFVDSFQKYEHKGILSKDDFYDSLNDRSISDEAYSQYLRSWNAIPEHERNLGTYSDMYLAVDTLILADLYESFRDQCLSHYNLDPVFYYSSPGLFFDGMLKYTNVELELLTDYNMILMIESGIRGGISSILGDRYVDVEGKNYATNPNIAKDDPNQEWLLYQDACNLYGHSMVQKLPQKNFRWLTENEIKDLNTDIRSGKTTGDGDIGHILKVDLIVPKTRPFFNLPLAPEKKVINYEHLSDYSKDVIGDHKKH
jgi:hypothetical protein